MAYKGPQELAQSLLNSNVNNGNPNGVYNQEKPAMNYQPWHPMYNNSSATTGSASAAPDLSKPANTNLGITPGGGLGNKPGGSTPGGGLGNKPGFDGSVPVPDNPGNPQDLEQPEGYGDFMSRLMAMINQRRADSGGGYRGIGRQDPPASDGRPPRYTAPTVDSSGRVTNNYPEFSLPEFRDSGPRWFPDQGVNPNDYLRDMFGPGGAMTPGGVGRPPGNQGYTAPNDYPEMSVRDTGPLWYGPGGAMTPGGVGRPPGDQGYPAPPQNATPPSAMGTNRASDQDSMDAILEMLRRRGRGG